MCEWLLSLSYLPLSCGLIRHMGQGSSSVYRLTYQSTGVLAWTNTVNLTINSAANKYFITNKMEKPQEKPGGYTDDREVLKTEVGETWKD